MKSKILKMLALVICITLLCSCGDKNILKTKTITDIITQTKVITQTDINENENYEAFLKDFKSDFTIPGLYEGIIPQGICYIDKLNLYAISGYYEDSAYPSMVMLIDCDTGKLTKAYPLQNVDGSNYYGHAGGIAASDNYIYVTSENTCYVYPVDNIKSLKSGEALKFESNFKLNTKGSFACYDNGILWTGDFIESNDKEREKASKITTLSSGETFYAYCEGYLLKDGLPDINKINSDKNGYIPDYMLAIPEQVQGMTLTASGKIIFSTSYGRKNDSKIYIYDNILLTEKIGVYTIDEKEIELLACSNDLLKNIITAPPMAEGIIQSEKGQIIIFESGAAKYRSHGGKHPTDTAFKGIIE